MAKIDQFLQIVKDTNATNLHLAAGSVPVIRINGDLNVVYGIKRVARFSVNVYRMCGGIGAAIRSCCRRRRNPSSHRPIAVLREGITG
jgi:Tfp pilus assembly pilus retraction ATPase PilT